MTSQEFRSLSRGDLLKVDGTGPVVVESAYLKMSGGIAQTFIDIRDQSGAVWTGLSDNDAVLFHHLKDEADHETRPRETLVATP